MYHLQVYKYDAQPIIILMRGVGEAAMMVLAHVRLRSFGWSSELLRGVGEAALMVSVHVRLCSL